MQPRRLAALALAVLLAMALGGSVAQARKAGVGRDGRPNILVVMTDDQATTDVRRMPNVRRLLARRGTTFADTVDSFPLCCPSRATFITGQYAHNHGVAGNFYPYGWYGMKNRRNTLPRWLRGRATGRRSWASGSTATARATPTARSRPASTSGGASSTCPRTTTSTT